MDDKTALVLEGGGLRGTYTAGVLDYFMEHELAFPYVIGTSAGACNATGYLSGQIGRTKKINTELLHTSKYKGLGQLMKNGTCSTRYPTRYFPLTTTPTSRTPPVL